MEKEIRADAEPGQRGERKELIQGPGRPKQALDFPDAPRAASGGAPVPSTLP